MYARTHTLKQFVIPFYSVFPLHTFLSFSESATVPKPPRWKKKTKGENLNAFLMQEETQNGKGILYFSSEIVASEDSNRQTHVCT